MSARAFGAQDGQGAVQPGKVDVFVGSHGSLAQVEYKDLILAQRPCHVPDRNRFTNICPARRPLLANRDEYYARPARAIDRWEDARIFWADAMDKPAAVGWR